jgi:REP element-mobilizing transposase RayT
MSEFGQIATEERLRTASIRQDVLQDEFVVVPNHLHGIIILTTDRVGATRQSKIPSDLLGGCPTGLRVHGPAPGLLGAIVLLFKSAATRRISTLNGTLGLQVWQNNCCGYIIREKAELNRIRQYITHNPLQSDLDEKNLNGRGKRLAGQEACDAQD